MCKADGLDKSNMLMIMQTMLIMPSVSTRYSQRP